MEKIRVLVANHPRLMREVVLATISDQPDIEIVGEIRDDSGIGVAVEESEPDFVILALGKVDQRPAVCADLIARFPQLKIVALAPERNSSMFIWAAISVQSKPIECSADGLLGALRCKSCVNG